MCFSTYQLVEHQIKMKDRTNISSEGIKSDDSLSVNRAESGPYGVPHTFTLADSFYDAQASDVFLQRAEHPISVEPPVLVEPPAFVEQVAPKLPNLSPPNYAQPAPAPAPVQAPEFAQSAPPPVFAAPPVAQVAVSQGTTAPQQNQVNVAPQVVSTPNLRPVSPRIEYRHLSPEERMQESFRIPIVATLVFVVTMIAIYYMGGQVGRYYAPLIQGDKVEFVGRPQSSS